jgi:hypothetical protein
MNDQQELDIIWDILEDVNCRLIELENNAKEVKEE